MTVELEFIIWFHNFLWLLEISNSENSQILDEKTKSKTMNKISLYKVIHNLHFMSHLWIVQKTELLKQPKFTSRKNAYFEKRLKNLPPQRRSFTVLMLLYIMNN